MQTNLRCAACGTLICPRCLVQTPVGAKCKGCTSQKGVSLFTLSPLQAARAIIAGLLMGAVAGFAVTYHFGLLTLLLAFAYGGFAGEMIRRASGRKRGAKMEVIAGVTMVAGALGGRILVAAMQLASQVHGRPPLGVLDVIASLVVHTPIPAIALLIAAAGAVSRIRCF